MVSRLLAAPERIVAFIDLGTNSVRISVVRINPNHSFTVLTQQKEIVRLGDGEFTTNHLQPEAMERAALVCGKFVELARAFGADEIIAVATSATREADNQTEFLERLRRDAQVDMRVISGNEEARLIYRGVASGIYLGEKSALFIDIGGGSTEIIIGDQQQFQFLDSLKLGAIRLSNLYLAQHVGAVSAVQYRRLCTHVRNAAIRSLQRARASAGAGRRQFGHYRESGERGDATER
jgi:exopolyphosphatase/guanosine-5'-triphosphate,3'-diphosphate pyrophosphatase